MVYRVYSEKRSEFATEAQTLLKNLKADLGLESIKSLRILNRYDTENIDGNSFDLYIDKVFSNPALDIVYTELPCEFDFVFAVEQLPGQYNQRADAAAQCIRLMSKSKKPLVKCAEVYLINGKLTEEELEAVKKYLINPVESFEATLDCFETITPQYDTPAEIETITGFRSMDDDELVELLEKHGFAMDIDDLKVCKNYFCSVVRDPSYTELRVLDTYWSDHCRHTTFLTTIDSVEINDSVVMAEYENYIKIRSELGRTKPVNLMDIATIGARYLKSKGKLTKLEESAEVNACTVKIDVDVGGETQEWLLYFKNETHNHPTEIEPFGGAATCLGGAIRDALSGRSYVYQALRLTGAGNPLTPFSKTLPGKLPQKKLTTTAAEGYSSYGNQIGLSAGLVDEIYHPGFVAKRMELGAVIGAAPNAAVVKEAPVPGDVVILLGGKTGRDGCGGATGSSKSHTVESLEKGGAEVQKGDAIAERYMQRLFRNPTTTRMIKRCNDFGAGGVAVAIGELADGLLVDLDRVPVKYLGLDGTELAISESQERMAVVVSADNAEAFIGLADAENLEATIVAEVTAEPYLRMNWNSKKIVDLSRSFLNSNGAEKHTEVVINHSDKKNETAFTSFTEGFIKTTADLNVCSKRGISDRFGSTATSVAVTMPLGGEYQITPMQAMLGKIPVLGKETSTCSVMAFGYNPFLLEQNQFTGAYHAVVESVSKLVAVGAYSDEVYLSFQEYFERLGKSQEKWGKPFAALLGALRAQLDLGVASVGGKDSMSGSFEDIHVPPTLISFAVSVANSKKIISPEFKKSGSKVIFIEPINSGELYNKDDLLQIYNKITALISDGKVISAAVPTFGGIAAAILKMCLGNRIGFEFADDVDYKTLFAPKSAGFILEVTDDVDFGIILGKTTNNYQVSLGNEVIPLDKVQNIYENVLESVFPTKIADNTVNNTNVEKISVQTFSRQLYTGKKVAKPKVLIPVFPGTNAEYEAAEAFEKAGATVEVMVIRNKTVSDIQESIEAFASSLSSAHILFIPGGSVTGDEPDGSAKFITAFLSEPMIRTQVESLIARDGLIGGIASGFQALLKLGLLPFGKYKDADKNSPTLAQNAIGRTVSRLVRTRVSSNKSPWYAQYKVGDIHVMPFASTEGRFVCSEEMLSQLIANGQIAAQYVDLAGNPTMDIDSNPGSSFMAIESITSPDGKIFGKMGHSERFGNGLYKNVQIGDDDRLIFESAVRYFTL